MPIKKYSNYDLKFFFKRNAVWRKCAIDIEDLKPLQEREKHAKLGKAKVLTLTKELRRGGLQIVKLCIFWNSTYIQTRILLMTQIQGKKCFRAHLVWRSVFTAALPVIISSAYTPSLALPWVNIYHICLTVYHISGKN